MHSIHVVDAFTDRPFSGNQAAVCILEAAADVEWMQAVAAEMNLSETAFLVPAGDTWDLRWFTPTKEVDLCGHATLASAHVLWTTGRLASGATAIFHTLSGQLTCTRDEAGRITMDFPIMPAHPSTMPDGAFQALGMEPVPVWEAPNGNLLVELETEAALRALAPNFQALHDASATHGFIVTAPADADDVDIVCRYFVPEWGINEDPATGSIQCTLAPHWEERFGPIIRTMQASARGASLVAERAGERVLVSGEAVTVLRGELDA